LLPKTVKENGLPVICMFLILIDISKFPLLAVKYFIWALLSSLSYIEVPMQMV